MEPTWGSSVSRRWNSTSSGITSLLSLLSERTSTYLEEYSLRCGLVWRLGAVSSKYSLAFASSFASSSADKWMSLLLALPQHSIFFFSLCWALYQRESLIFIEDGRYFSSCLLPLLPFFGTDIWETENINPFSRNILGSLSISSELVAPIDDVGQKQTQSRFLT